MSIKKLFKSNFSGSQLKAIKDFIFFFFEKKADIFSNVCVYKSNILFGTAECLKKKFGKSVWNFKII